MKISNLVVGVLFIIFGGVLAISLFTDMNFEFWPIFVLAPGLIFEFSYFSRPTKPKAGLLVPGGILTIIGLLFFFESLTNWQYAEYTWPIYLISVAVGLFQLFIFGNRDKGILIPVGILSTLSIIFFLQMIIGSVEIWKYFGPALLILGGLFIIFSGRKKKENFDFVSSHEPKPASEDESFTVVEDDEEEENIEI